MPQRPPAVPARVFTARAVCRSLERAEMSLCEALGATEDPTVSDSIDRARKALRPARNRAAAVLKDLDLRTAPQTGLGL